MWIEHDQLRVFGFFQSPLGGRMCECRSVTEAHNGAEPEVPPETKAVVSRRGRCRANYYLVMLARLARLHRLAQQDK